MQTIRITTSQNIDIDYEIATLGDRALGRVVDMGVVLGLYYVFYILTLIIIFGGGGAAFEGGGFPTFIIVELIVFSIIYAFYDLVCEVFFNGRSLGKYAMKMRVVSLDGARPSISQYLLRWVFRVVDFLTTGGLGAVAIISVSISAKKQRIGDIVAGTIVIKTTPRAALDQLLFQPADDDYEPRFPAVTQLTDNDMGLVHEVINNFRQTGNSDVVYNMSVRLQQHLGIQCPPDLNDYQFLVKLSEDYNYLTSRAEA
ncbi:MAG TPA: RDD family protein [Mucilaginibacter sp.]|jgi:uncharacterized RDD family membrane protein YckC|nr:RDD family protein [Mucilaginibacter sp.]